MPQHPLNALMLPLLTHFVDRHVRELAPQLQRPTTPFDPHPIEIVHGQQVTAWLNGEPTMLLGPNSYPIP